MSLPKGIGCGNLVLRQGEEKPIKAGLHPRLVCGLYLDECDFREASANRLSISDVQVRRYRERIETRRLKMHTVRGKSIDQPSQNGALWPRYPFVADLDDFLLAGSASPVRKSVEMSPFCRNDFKRRHSVCPVLTRSNYCPPPPKRAS